jgi:RNA polymerase sigma-70 factor (ECF subfamily)
LLEELRPCFTAPTHRTFTGLAVGLIAARRLGPRNDRRLADTDEEAGLVLESARPGGTVPSDRGRRARGRANATASCKARPVTEQRGSRREAVAPPVGEKAPPGGLEVWLGRVGSGDLEAFDRVYGAVAAMVFGIAARVLQDTALAEEVAQEAMVEVWRSAGRFDPARGSARAWVSTIAHRRAVDRVRSERATQEREKKAAAHASDGGAFDQVAESVAARLEQQQVRHCLDGLTELQRESVTLAYYGGYTYPQVADALGVPLGTVKTRLRDALAKLRDCLGVGR